MSEQQQTGDSVVATLDAELTIEERIARIIEEWDDDDVPAVVAAKLRAQLEEECPELLDAWLAEQADAMLTMEIRRRVTKPKGGRKNGTSSKFSDALERAATDDLDALASFEFRHRIDGEDKAVADLTGDDHTQLASRYQNQATTDVMLAAFHRAVAKAVGRKRTADVMTEANYRANLEGFAHRMLGS